MGLDRCRWAHLDLSHASALHDRVTGSRDEGEQVSIFFGARALPDVRPVPEKSPHQGDGFGIDYS